MSMNMMESVNMKKGFTLIELLVVIALLGVIAVLVTTSVIGIMNRSRSSLSETQRNTIEDAAEKWGAINADKMPYNDGDTIDVDIKDLADEGYIDSSDLKNPKNSKELCGVVRISYKADNNQYSYEFVEEDC